MNIIITEELHNNLQKHVISTIEFGSALKGESTKNSDRDLLHIVESADWWVSSTVANQHLLQYKTENEDHIYCTAHTFVKSLLDGDTTVFLEMHKYGGLKNTCLDFLNKYEFVFYRSLRAYLGISRRDIKDVKKLWKNKDTEMRKINKKFKFTQQGVDFVVEHLTKKCSNEVCFNAFIEQYNILKSDLLGERELFEIDDKTTYQEVDSVCIQYTDMIELVRVKLNSYIERGCLEKTFDKKTFIALTKELNENIEVKNTMKECEESVMEYFYDSYIGEI